MEREKMPKSIDVQIDEMQNRIKILQQKLKHLNSRKATLILSKVKQANKATVKDHIKNGLSVDEIVKKLTE